MSALLGSIAVEPHRLADVPTHQLPALLTELASLQAHFAARMATDQRPAPAELLRIAEAARRLDVSVDWLYRHADSLPFVRRPGPGQLRFDAAALAEYLKGTAEPKP